LVQCHRLAHYNHYNHMTPENIASLGRDASATLHKYSDVPTGLSETTRMSSCKPFRFDTDVFKDAKQQNRPIESRFRVVDLQQSI
jgi:hypothetical protein